jgi:hypothetical protein
MADRQQDTELRARFQAQRDKEAGDTPAFAPLLARARADAAQAEPVSTHQSWGRRRVLYAGGLAAAALIATVLLLPRSESSEAAFERAVRNYQSASALGGWQSPTDGLLNVPGGSLMTSVPRIGAQP